MSRKRKNIVADTSIKEIVDEKVTIINNESIETPTKTEEEELNKAELERIQKTIAQKFQIDSPVSLNVVNTKTVVNPLYAEILEYSKKYNVSMSTSIKLAQRLLNIKETGEWDELTRSAFAQLSNRSDFLNDYRNARK